MFQSTDILPQMLITMELVFVAILLAYLQSFVLSNSQGDALYALKLSMKIPDNQLTDWKTYRINPCTWSNVVCDQNNHVTALSLSGFNYSGTLSPKIGGLKTLTTLTLRGNGITGGIPKEFGNLSNLTSLNLENNCLSGEIPSSLGDLKKLKILILSKNNLSGPIPESLAGLPNLIQLLLDSNNLSGRIPDHIFQVPSYNFTGNYLNCGGAYLHLCDSAKYDSDSGVSYESNKSNIRIIIIVGYLGGFAILSLLGGILFFLWKGL